VDIQEQDVFPLFFFKCTNHRSCQIKSFQFSPHKNSPGQGLARGSNIKF
jgi:hypothetical protein